MAPVDTTFPCTAMLTGKLPSWLRPLCGVPRAGATGWQEDSGARVEDDPDPGDLAFSTYRQFTVGSGPVWAVCRSNHVKASGPSTKVLWITMSVMTCDMRLSPATHSAVLLAWPSGPSKVASSARTKRTRSKSPAFYASKRVPATSAAVVAVIPELPSTLAHAHPCAGDPAAVPQSDDCPTGPAASERGQGDECPYPGA
jgi:hypothetical protein